MLPAIEHMYYLIISFVIFLVVVVGGVVAIKNGGRIAKLEREVFKLLKGLDDKNYTLWKQKLKAEEEVKKLKKSATLKS
jgi:hypothetical protein